MMYAYLSRKVTLFNQNELRCVAWNKKEGWLSIGGSAGLLKIIKLDSTNEEAGEPVINQTLRGHSGAVICLAWNVMFEKLASTDEHGLTIVWGLQDGTWCEDMVNNRHISYVTDMKWTSDGGLICITYKDGAVIVGSVEGSRLWGIEMGVSLQCLEWSPDTKHMVFVTDENKIEVYDKFGSHLRVMDSSDINDINSIHWYDDLGISRREGFTLAVASMSGQIKLMKGIESTNTLIINSTLQRVICRWNLNGNILAACGQHVSHKEEGMGMDSNLVVNFYDSNGDHLYGLTICQNEKHVDIEWEASGLRLAVVTERCIYFVNVKPPHKWTALHSTSTLVYESNESGKVIFLNTKRDQKVEKSFGNVTNIYGAEKYCMLTTSNLESTSELESNHPSVMVCDEMGKVCSTKQLKIHPNHISMTDNVIVITDHRNVYVHIFHPIAREEGSSSQSNFSKKSSGMERMFDIHDKSIHPSKAKSTYDVNIDSTTPTITAIYANATICLIAKEDNHVLVYSLPNITRLNQISINCSVPKTIQLNSDSTKFSIIDADNTFLIFNLQKHATSKAGISPPLDSSNVDHVWDMKWSQDDPNACVIMERGNVVEIGLREHVNISKHEILAHSEGYLMKFSNLEITLVLLDDIMIRPYAMSGCCTLSLPTLALEDMRIILTKELDSEELLSKFSRTSHKHLWKLLAHKSLEKLDFVTSEKAFVLCQDYRGIFFSESMSVLNDQSLQQAEVLKFLGRYSDAEKKYIDMNRIDLAIRMYLAVGDWAQVTSLGARAELEDCLLQEVWSSMADSFFDCKHYEVAAEYYENAGNFNLAISCLIRCQDYKSVQRIIDGLDSKSAWLKGVTQLLLTSGLYKLAITCQKKIDMKLALDTCVNLSMWEEASYLADEGGLRSDLEEIVKGKTRELLKQDEHLRALELCQCVDLASDAAEILCRLAESKKGNIPPAIAKKLFILAAKQVERHREKAIDMSQLTKPRGGKATSDIASSIGKFMDDNCKDESAKNRMKVFSNAWRSAAAYHYFLLANKELYTGKIEIAMKAAIRCCEFIDILNSVQVYSLIALTSYMSKYFEVCSMSLTKLLTLDNIDKTSILLIQKLAFAIFTQQKPVNKKDLDTCYKQCLESGKGYHACTITGKSIVQKRALQCRYCRFYMLEEEARGRSSCALCHDSCRDAEVVTILA